MTFDEFYYEATQEMQNSAPLADFVDDVTQYFYENIYPDVEMEVLFNYMAHVIFEHTRFDVLYRIALQEAQLELRSRYDFTNMVVIYNDDAIEAFRDIVEKLYKYHKSHPKGQLTLPGMKEDTYEQYMEKILKQNRYISDWAPVLESAEEELARDEIEKVYKDLDKIETNWKNAVGEIWQNEDDWIREMVEGELRKLEYYSEEERQKEKFLKWMFEYR